MKTIKILSLVAAFLSLLALVSAGSVFSNPVSEVYSYTATDFIEERVNYTVNETWTVNDTDGGNNTTTKWNVSYNVRPGMNEYLFDLGNFWIESKEKECESCEFREMDVTLRLEPNTLSEAIQGNKEPWKTYWSNGSITDWVNKNYYLEGGEFTEDNLTAFNNQLSDMPIYENGDLVKTVNLKSKPKNVTAKLRNDGTGDGTIRIGNNSIVVNVESQSDWNQAGTANFNGTTTDANDSDGDLQIGYRNGTSSDSLQAFWRLDNTSSNAFDYSGNGRHISIQNTPVKGVGGVFSTDSFSFEGDYLLDSDAAWHTSDSMTISAWVNPDKDAPSDLSVVLAKWEGGGDLSYRISRNTDESLRVEVETAGGTTINTVNTATDTFENDVWSHVVMRYDHTTENLSAWINGEFKNSGIGSSGGINDGGADLRVASERPGAPRYIDARIDEVKMYHGTLTDKEIKREYFYGRDGTFNAEYNRTSDNVASGDKIDNATVWATQPSASTAASINFSHNESGEWQMFSVSDGRNFYTLDQLSTAGGGVDTQINGTTSNVSESWQIQNLSIESSTANAAPSVDKPEVSPNSSSAGMQVTIDVNVTDPDGDDFSVRGNVSDADGNQEIDRQFFTNISTFPQTWQLNYTSSREPSDIGTNVVDVQANDTNGAVGTNSSAFDVFDGNPPEWRNLMDNISGRVAPGTVVNVSAECRDNETGCWEAYLATNETGVFTNYTGGTYDSPNTFSNQTQQFVLSTFQWQNDSFSGTLFYKVWIRDASDNWNVTDLGTVNMSPVTFNRSAQEALQTIDTAEITPNRVRDTNESLTILDGEFPFNTSDLLAYWTTDDRDTNATHAFDVIKGINGRLNVTATGRSGAIDETYTWDGVNDYLNVSYTDKLEFNATFTWAAWINHTTSNTVYIASQAIGTANGGYEFAVTQNDLILQVADSGFGSHTVRSDTKLGQNSATHVAGSYNTTHLCLYIDGVKEKCNKDSFVPLSPDEHLFIGAIDDNGIDFVIDGWVDEFHIYNRSLSENEIQQDYNQRLNDFAPTRTASFNRDNQEATFISDTVDRVNSFVRDAAEGLNIIDFVRRGFIVSASDALQTSDNTDSQRSFNRDNREAMDAIDVVDRVFSSFREASESINVSENADRDNSFVRDVFESLNIIEVVDRTASFFREATENLLIIDKSQRGINPVINNVTLRMHNVSDTMNLTLEVNVTDPDGNSNRESISYNTVSRQINTTKDVVTLDIVDNTSQTGNITVRDAEELTVSRELDFDIVERNWSQLTKAVNLSLQKISINSTVNNTGSIESFWANLSHNTHGATVLEGGFDVSLLAAGEKTSLRTNLTGDLLDDDNNDWVQNVSARSYDTKQFIRRALNVSSLPLMRWENVSTGSVSTIQGFDACDDCSDRNITVDNQFNNFVWGDTGDVIEDVFVKSVEQDLIGSRDEYWEQYRYRNQSDRVDWGRIVANVTIDDTKFNFGQFIRVKTTNGTQFIEFEPTVTDNCGQEDADRNVTVVNGETFESCAADFNDDTSDRTEFFELTWRDFSTQDNVRYGGLLGTAPSAPTADFEGQRCSPSDSVSIEELNDARQEASSTDELKNELPLESITGDLVCVNEQLRDIADLERLGRSVGENIEEIIAGIILGTVAMFIFILLFIDEDSIGGFLRQFSDSFAEDEV